MVTFDGMTFGEVTFGETIDIRQNGIQRDDRFGETRERGSGLNPINLMR